MNTMDTCPTQWTPVQPNGHLSNPMQYTYSAAKHNQDCSCVTFFTETLTEMETLDKSLLPCPFKKSIRVLTLLSTVLQCNQMSLNGSMQWLDAYICVMFFTLIPSLIEMKIQLHREVDRPSKSQCCE